VVAPSARRQGHGAALLAAALEVLRGEGAAGASLHVDADAGGAAARALYGRFGFAAAAGGLAQDYYGVGRHALLLRAELEA
jgi:ribosomal protein S18 acetylase RimI-like enzyme